MNTLFNCSGILTEIIKFMPVSYRESIIKISGILSKIHKNVVPSYGDESLDQLCKYGCITKRIIKTMNERDIKKLVESYPFVVILAYDIGRYKPKNSEEMVNMLNTFAAHREELIVSSRSLWDNLLHPIKLVPVMPEICNKKIISIEELNISIPDKEDANKDLQFYIRSIELTIQLIADGEENKESEEFVRYSYVENKLIPLEYKLSFQNKSVVKKLLCSPSGIKFIVEHFRKIPKDQIIQFMQFSDGTCKLFSRSWSELWDRGLIDIGLISMYLTKFPQHFLTVDHSVEFQYEIIRVIEYLLQINGNKFLEHLSHNIFGGENRCYRIREYIVNKMIDSKIITGEYMLDYYNNNCSAFVNNFKGDDYDSALINKVTKLEKSLFYCIPANVLSEIIDTKIFETPERVKKYKFLTTIYKKGLTYYSRDELLKFVENEKTIAGHTNIIAIEAFESIPGLDNTKWENDD